MMKKGLGRDFRDALQGMKDIGDTQATPRSIPRPSPYEDRYEEVPAVIPVVTADTAPETVHLKPGDIVETPNGDRLKVEEGSHDKVDPVPAAECDDEEEPESDL